MLSLIEFSVSDFFRLFISFKYGLILLRYFLTDSDLFLSPLLSYSIYCYWFITIFFFILKIFQISLIILSLIALFSFFSLKRLISLTVFSSISFFNLKRFLIFSIVVSSFCHLFFQSKNISYIFNYLLFIFLKP